MRKNKKQTLKAALAVMALATLGGAAFLTAPVASVEAADADFAMVSGASVRISDKAEEAGIRFRAVVKDYDPATDTAEYGVMVVRNDWIQKWGITDNWVEEVQAKYDALDETVKAEYPAPIQVVTPKYDEKLEEWTVVGSLVGVLEENYDREFFGIAYKKVNGVYEYAATEVDGNADTVDNVRSISTVALGAMLDDSEADNNTATALDCFARYTTTSGARRVNSASQEINADNQAKDFTFLMKATETNAAKTSAVSFAVKTGENINAEGEVNLNTESDFDGVFTVESENVGDGWYQITVNSDLFADGNTLTVNSTDSVVIKDAKFVAHNAYAMTVGEKSLSLITPKTLTGEEHTFKKTATLTVNSEKAYAATTAKAGVATAEGNVITATGSGDTTVTLKSRYATAEVTVRVSYPISSADDLDFLALVTYTEDKATAESYLAANYLFTNDIDYASHTRNYILPIASVNHEHGRWSYNSSTGKYDKQAEDFDNATSSTKGDFALGGLTRGTYYSIGWKDVLGLGVETTTVGSTANVHYMTNSDKAGYQEEGKTYGTMENEFRGVNPNGLAFSGRMDGNGYAIKNAYYMLDNLQGQPQNPGSAGYSGLGGFFVGYNVGTVENLEMFVSVADPAAYYYNNGAYSKTQKDNSLKVNELYLNEGRTAQIWMLNSTGGVHTALTGKYNPHKSNTGIGATGMVAVNNGVLQNLYHKVNVYASIAESLVSTQGVIASINGYEIKNCVVDKFAQAQLPGDATIATKTLNAKAGNYYNKDTQTYTGNLERYAFVGEIKGSNITNCYSLSKRDGTTSVEAYKSKATALTFGEGSSFFGGTIDELSNTVYTTLQAGTTAQDWNADYAAMYAAYEQNKNLDTVIWNITNNDGTIAIALNDDLAGINA